MNLTWLPEARIEVQEAVEWYEDQRAGLGEELAGELAHVVSLIERFPDAWHPLTKRIRRQRLDRFPYNVVYARAAQEIVVLVFSHQHRHPGYWRKRLKGIP